MTISMPLYSVMLIMVLSGFGRTFNDSNSSPNSHDYLMTLRDSLQEIADSCNGEIGIALISDTGDTLSINNDLHYPMMSVFKLHQAIATCQYMDQMGISLDSNVIIPRGRLNPHTWSPMLKDYERDTLRISYRRLFQYAIEQSDNNASNYLFETLQSPCSVDSTLSKILPNHAFKISHSEAAMQSNHALAFENYTTPLAATELINTLYTDSTLHRSESMEFIRSCLGGCKTGTDRISLPLLNKTGVSVAHKTGSGFIDNGVLIAHNDVAFIKLPNDRYYAIGVFIKNFKGSEAEASSIISRISQLVYTTVCNRISTTDAIKCLPNNF